MDVPGRGWAFFKTSLNMNSWEWAGRYIFPNERVSIRERHTASPDLVQDVPTNERCYPLQLCNDIKDRKAHLSEAYARGEATYVKLPQ